MAKFANKEEYEKWKTSKTAKENSSSDEVPDNDTSVKAEIKPAPPKNKNKTVLAISMLVIVIAFMGMGVDNYLSKRPNSALEKYNNKTYWLEEGISLSGTTIDHFITPTVVKVSYHPDISKDTLFLNSETADKSAMVDLEGFEALHKDILNREATQEENFNAKWYREKRDAGELIDSVRVRDYTVRKGDLADDVFIVFTKDMETGKPDIVPGTNGEPLYIHRDYIWDGIKYSLTFKRMENGSDEYCRDCPYRLRTINSYPNKALTFKEYKQKYWTASK